MSHYTKLKLKQQKILPHVLQLFEKYMISSMRWNKIRDCASNLFFVADVMLQKIKLTSSNFCEFSFCPGCENRLARKNALKISALMQYLHDDHQKEFIFLTLTSPNVSAENLSQEITKFNRAFNRLMVRKEVVPVIKGYVRKLEVTYNSKRNDFHPHFHVLIAVNKSYFGGSRTYLPHAKWLELWQSVMRDSSITSLNIQKVDFGHTPEEMSKAAYRVAGYQCKENSKKKIMDVGDYPSEVFETFYTAMKGRQIITFNGLFNEANKKYKAKELDKYKERDLTQYVYMILKKWGWDDYVEFEKRELTDREKQKFNNLLFKEIDADDLES